MRHQGRSPPRNGRIKLQPLSPDQMAAPVNGSATVFRMDIPHEDVKMLLDLASATGQADIKSTIGAAIAVFRQLHALHVQGAKIVVYLDDKPAGTLNVFRHE